MKRSAQVVLVVMAATGVGATSMALMPRQDCSQTQPDAPQTETCRRGSGGSGGGRSSYFWSHGSSGTSTTSTSSGSTSSGSSFFGGIARGGFGGTAHAMGGGHGASS